MTENRESNATSSKYKRQIRMAMITVFIIELVVISLAIYIFKFRR